MKKIINYIILFFLCLLVILVFVYKKNVNKSILSSFIIFKDNIFPNMFPFLIISSLLINYGFVNVCFNIFNPITQKLFKSSGSASFVFFTSILSGTPSNAKYTKDLYLNNIIDEKEATKILTYTHFINPLFIIGMTSLFVNIKTSYYILIIQYLTNIIIGILFRNMNVSNSNKMKKINKISFGECLSKAISSSINTLLLIFGTITVFLILSELLPFKNPIINSILEVTQGIKTIGLLNLSEKTKAILFTMLLSFGGISIHMQILSIISDTKIKYMPYLIARLLHSAISGTLMYLIL